MKKVKKTSLCKKTENSKGKMLRRNKGKKRNTSSMRLSWLIQIEHRSFISKKMHNFGAD